MFPFGSRPGSIPAYGFQFDRARPRQDNAHFFDGLHQFMEVVASSMAEESMAEEQSRPAGTSDSALQHLPVIKVSDYDIQKNSTGECVICLEKFVVGEEACRIPCDHLFHERCIKEWLKTNHKCPVCRYEMPTDASTVGEQQVRTMWRNPRLRRQDLYVKSVKELRHLAQHLGVNIAGCLEKGDLVRSLIESGRVDIVPDEASGALPSVTKWTSAQLASLSVCEIREQMTRAGLDCAGCLSKRDLIQRLISAGRVVSSVSSHASASASSSACPAESSTRSAEDCSRRAMDTCQGNQQDSSSRDVVAYGLVEGEGLDHEEDQKMQLKTKFVSHESTLGTMPMVDEVSYNEETISE